MGTIVRTIHVAHRNGRLLGGLLHYVNAASNHAANGYRSGVRGKELYRMAIHRTGIYQSRFADHIIRDVYGSHRAWRTSQRMDPHARAPHHHDAAAQTDCFQSRCQSRRACCGMWWPTAASPDGRDQHYRTSCGC